MEIVKATPMDLEAIYALELKCFPSEAWSRAVFREELSGSRSLYLLAKKDQGVQGYITAAIDEGARYAHITSLAVAPDWQRRGVGTALLEDLLGRLASRGIQRFRAETRLSNDHVQALFLRHGFYEEMIIAGYYQHPTEAAVVLLRHALPTGDTP